MITANYLTLAMSTRSAMELLCYFRIYLLTVVIPTSQAAQPGSCYDLFTDGLHHIAHAAETAGQFIFI